MSEAKKTKILFVDDDPDYRFITSTRLRSVGYEVLEASSEAEGLKYLSSETFDLALVDLMMEHEDSGFIIAYKLNKLKPQIPIVICSSITNKTGIRLDLSSADEASWLRASIMIQKGTRFEVLHEEIRKLLDSSNKA